MANVTVKAVSHKDIRGKELLYLVASNGLSEVVVNVGEKTYNAVKALHAEEFLSEGQRPILDPEKEALNNYKQPQPKKEAAKK